MPRMSSGRLLIAATVFGLMQTSCGVPLSGRPPAAKPLRLEPIHLSLDPQGRVQVADAMALFETAGRHFAARRYLRALASYEQLFREFPKSALVSPALYNAGLAHEQLGRFDLAARRYETLIERFGHTRNAVDAAFRLGACYAELRRWKRSAAVYLGVLRRRDLSNSDRIEAFARTALAYFRDGDLEAATRTLRDAVRFHDSVDPFERLESDFFVGMIYYYRAALPHVSFRNAPLEGTRDDRLGQQLDEKARLLLVSQGRYIEAIKTRNPYWATAAGFQIGSLYREFYDVMMRSMPDFNEKASNHAKRLRIPIEAAEAQLKQAYLEQLHERARPLLEKAIRVFEKNVVVAERLGVRGSWVDKSRGQMRILKELLVASPQQAVKRLPRAPVLPEDEAEPFEPAKPGVEPMDPPPETRPGLSGARQLL